MCIGVGILVSARLGSILVILAIKAPHSGGNSGNFSQKFFFNTLLPSCINLYIATYMFSVSASRTGL